MLFVGLSVHILFTFITELRNLAHLIKMFGCNVYSAIEPADSPAVKADAVENFFVAQRGKEFVLFNEWQTVEDSLASIVES